ncbi:MAG TPA: hypothetical protein VHK69_12530, partial [Chitinophagaceae bacterium]|nr:hypothetical protein [Chitinophagaceae bacterium]
HGGMVVCRLWVRCSYSNGLLGKASGSQCLPLFFLAKILRRMSPAETSVNNLIYIKKERADTGRNDRLKPAPAAGFRGQVLAVFSCRETGKKRLSFSHYFSHNSYLFTRIVLLKSLVLHVNKNFRMGRLKPKFDRTFC